MRFLACCRRLWRLEPSLASVWHSFDVEVRSEAAAQALLRWVHARRHRLRKVELSIAETEEGEEVDGNQTLYVASLLGGAPVEELRVELLSGEFELSSWLAAAAPYLRALGVYCEGSIAVRPSFSLLTSLTQLSLNGEGGGTEMPPGCLPPSLRAVDLFAPPAALLEGSLAAAAPSLESCRLSWLGADFSLSPLPRFTALTLLEIQSYNWDVAPAELAERVLRLPRLKVRRCDCSFLSSPLLTELPQQVTCCHCLQCGTAGLCLNLGPCPSQELTFWYKTNVALPAVEAPAPLETLKMGFTSAARSHAALARLATLRTLELLFYIDLCPPSAADAAALLAALAGLKGVLVEWKIWSFSGGRQFRPSDPLQMAGLAMAFVQAYPELSSMPL